MSYPCFSDISRNFAPGWFAAVMGSGVLALTTATLAAYWPPLSLAATVLHWFTTVLFLLLALPWVCQWLRFRPQALQILAHPVQGSFYPHSPSPCWYWRHSGCSWATACRWH